MISTFRHSALIFRSLIARIGVALCLLCAAFTANAQSAVIYAYRATANDLVSFSATAPQTLLTLVTLSGLGAGQQLIGIDFRPATGELYGIAKLDAIRFSVVKINTQTGAVNTVFPSFDLGSAPVNGGVGFNPVADQIRFVSEQRDNRRLNPDTGATVGIDTLLNYGGPIPTNVAHVAYSNSIAGATLTTAYAIDFATDFLVRIGGPDGTPSPNGGVLTNIGALGVDADAVGGFDIQAGTNTAYAALRVGGASRLYTINLGTGAATLLGPFVDTGTVDGMAIAPINPCLDVDGDGSVNALTDGLMLLRALLGMTGTAVTSNALPTPAPPRATWPLIRTHFHTNCGLSFAP